MSPGRLQKHPRVYSRFLRNRRDLVVYLPLSYDREPHRRFPVLYLQDGQNLFDGATSFIPGMDWHVGQTADHFIGIGAVEPLIIVGIYNTGKSRIQEYTPTRVPKLGGGRAERYEKFILRELMPDIGQHYRTLQGRDFTGLGGSSLGGLVSLFIGLRHPQVFGKLAALSPSIWWNQRVIERFAEAAPESPLPRIWLDAGTREGPGILNDVQHFRDVLLRKGGRLDESLHCELVEGAEHNEAAWAARVGSFLQFLFPAR